MFLDTRQKLVVFMRKFNIREKDLAAMLDYHRNHFSAVLNGWKPITPKMQRHIDKLFKEYNFDEDPQESNTMEGN